MANQLALFDDEQIIKSSKVFYIYILLNSLTNEIIYIGKGSGNRMNDHLAEFYNITNFKDSETNSFREIKNKKKFSHLNRIKIFIDILNSGGEITCDKVYENLEEEKAYKIEKLLIFILKRRVDYLFSTKIDGKRVSLKKHKGKLLNKAVGGRSQPGAVWYDCVNLETVIDDFTSVQSDFKKNDFIERIKNGDYSNKTDINKYPNLKEYVINEISNIRKEINEFKILNGIN